MDCDPVGEPRTIRGPCFDECDRGLKVLHEDGTVLPCRCKTLSRCKTVEVVRIEPEETAWLSRAEVDSCILRTGDNAPPGGVVLVSENPPRMISSDDYNTRPNVPPRMM